MPLRRLSLISCFVFACAGSVFAQSFPNGPVNVVVPLAPLGILQAYATPEQQAAEIREEFRRVAEMAKKAGLTK